MGVMRSRAVAVTCVAMLLGLAVAGCASTASPATNLSGADCAGIRVIVSFDVLNSPAIDVCAPAESTELTVADARAEVGVVTEGTADYGDAVVCRVNGLPSANAAFTVPGHDAYTETCATMPPEFAYWALWLKGTGSSSHWDYASEGVSTQLVHPGDSVGLMFSSGGQTPMPVDS